MIKYLPYSEQHHLKTNNLLWLLIALMAILVFPAFSIIFNDYTPLIFNICYSLVIIAGIYIVTDSKLHLFIGSILGASSLFFIWSGINHNSFQPFSRLLFFTFLAYQIVSIIIRSDVVTLNLIYGAIIGYMLIGLIGGQLCLILDNFEPNSFLSQKELTPYSYLYFAFVSLTTLGFGDIVPQNDAARGITLLIAFLGQIYLTTLIAILVGAYLRQEKKQI